MCLCSFHKHVTFQTAFKLWIKHYYTADRKEKIVKRHCYTSGVYLSLNSCSYAWYTKLILISVVQPPGTLQDTELELSTRSAPQAVSLSFSMLAACSAGKTLLQKQLAILCSTSLLENLWCNVICCQKKNNTHINCNGERNCILRSNNIRQ